MSYLKSDTGLLLLLLLLLPGAAAEQAGAASDGGLLSVRFLSEFRRVSPQDGTIGAADAAGAPREIISPAIVRNGFTSFSVVASGPPRQPYRLFIALNPDGLLRPVLARVAPDGMGLQPPLPKLEAEGTFNDRGTALYWLDVWTPGATPVRRIRLEAQLSFANEWVITPLELRVMAATVPERPLPAAPRAALAARPSSAVAQALFEQYLCGTPEPPRDRAAINGIPAKLQRNAGQDILIAQKLEGKEGGRSAVEPMIAKALERESVAAWCAQPAGARRLADPEAFLRIRDALWRADR